MCAKTRYGTFTKETPKTSFLERSDTTEFTVASHLKKEQVVNTLNPPCIRCKFFFSYTDFTTGGGRIKHVRVLLGVPTLQILRFEKKKSSKRRIKHVRALFAFSNFLESFSSRNFFSIFFRPRGEFVAFPSQSRLVVGDIRKNGQNFSDLTY